MDISKVPHEKKLYLCRWYFKAGFALLPFVWAINFCWFFSEAFRKPAYKEQSEIKRLVIYSGLGAVIWLIAIIAWVSVFQSKRAEWGATADYMSFIIPLGRA